MKHDNLRSQQKRNLIVYINNIPVKQLAAVSWHVTLPNIQTYNFYQRPIICNYTYYSHMPSKKHPKKNNPRTQ